MHGDALSSPISAPFFLLLTLSCSWATLSLMSYKKCFSPLKLMPEPSATLSMRSMASARYHDEESAAERASDSPDVGSRFMMHESTTRGVLRPNLHIAVRVSHRLNTCGSRRRLLGVTRWILGGECHLVDEPNILPVLSTPLHSKILSSAATLFGKGIAPVLRSFMIKPSQPRVAPLEDMMLAFEMGVLLAVITRGDAAIVAGNVVSPFLLFRASSMASLILPYTSPSCRQRTQ